MRKMLGAAVLLVSGFTLAASVHARDGWDPARAATYLDSRQQKWSVGPPAPSPDGPCVSCHTGMPYLLARPALRRFLHETAPTMHEVSLRDRLKAHAGSKPAAA